MLRRIDPTTTVFAVLAVAAGVGVYILQGGDAVVAALTGAFSLLVQVVPVLIAAVLIAGYTQTLVPRRVMERWLGEGSGLRGLLLATVAGAVTPGGPFAAFPLVVGLLRSGAAFQVAVTYLTAWATLGLNRVLIWEIPFFGFEFVALRLLVSLPLPILAGLLAGVLAHRVPALRRAGC